jgi:hypothetical protein
LTALDDFGNNEEAPWRYEDYRDDQNQGEWQQERSDE